MKSESNMDEILGKKTKLRMPRPPNNDVQFSFNKTNGKLVLIITF